MQIFFYQIQMGSSENTPVRYDQGNLHKSAQGETINQTPIALINMKLELSAYKFMKCIIQIGHKDIDTNTSVNYGVGKSSISKQLRPWETLLFHNKLFII